jgi:hypothetical protein
MENPLRSEAQMFRVVVIFGIAAAIVIAAALIIDPIAGLIVLGLELGFGIGLILRGSRG